MSPTLYDSSVPYFTSGLNVLAHILTKAEEYAKDKGLPESDFTTARLVDDMRPLTFQIQTASNTVKNSLVRFAKSTASPMEDNETTFAELQARIAKTLELLQSTDKAGFEGPLDETVVMKVSNSEVSFTRMTYVQKFAIPNFYFHVVTAYAILRSKGVPIGKMDFLTPLQSWS